MADDDNMLYTPYTLYPIYPGDFNDNDKPDNEQMELIRKRMKLHEQPMDDWRQLGMYKFLMMIRDILQSSIDGNPDEILLKYLMFFNYLHPLIILFSMSNCMFDIIGYMVRILGLKLPSICVIEHAIVMFGAGCLERLSNRFGHDTIVSLVNMTSEERPYIHQRWRDLGFNSIVEYMRCLYNLDINDEVIGIYDTCKKLMIQIEETAANTKPVKCTNHG